MRLILPTLKEKKRYIGFEIISDGNFKIDFKTAKNAIKRSLLNFLGEYGLARAGILFVPKYANNRGIIKTNVKEVDKVRAALSLVKSIENKKVLIRTITVSGILNKAIKKTFAAQEGKCTS